MTAFPETPSHPTFMIEQIQKYKIIITIALVAVGAGFLLGGSSLRKLGGAGAGGTPVLTIAGRTYDDREFHRLGTGSFELLSNLARSGDFDLYQFLMGLAAGATSQKDAPEKFFIGRMILRQSKEEFGVYPSDDEISNYIRGLHAFAGPESKFNEETYRHFVEKGIGRLGLTEGDLRDLIADVLASKKINAIVGAGLGVNRDLVAQNLALDNQQLAGELARLDIDPFTAKIEPTDEQIKAYWQNLQDAFTTEPLRKFTYFIATPDLPADTDADKPADSIADAVLSDDARKSATKKKEADKAQHAAELAEARRKKQIELDSRMNDFTDELDLQKAPFEELVQNKQWEVKATDLFPRSKAPKELNVSLRSTSRGGQLVDELFHIEPTSDPLSKFSQPIAIGENQWIIARLDGEEKSRAKTYAEAKDEARAKYIEEKAAEAMKSAANQAATKIKSALTSGKSFAEAAKEASITQVKAVINVNSTYRPDAATEPKNLFDAGRNADPGTLAEVILEADRAFIFYVAKREVVKDTHAAAHLDSEVTSLTRANETLAFSSWIAARIEAAKVEQLYK